MRLIALLLLAASVQAQTICMDNNIVYDSSGVNQSWIVGDSLPPAGSMAPDIDLHGFNPSQYTGLVVNGSASCNQFNIAIEIWKAAGAVVIYTIEAHPIDSVSPYCGCWWTLPPATPQATHYAQRVSQAFALQMNHGFSVYPDSPCNEWWKWGGMYPAGWYMLQDGVVTARGVKANSFVLGRNEPKKETWLLLDMKNWRLISSDRLIGPGIYKRTKRN